MPNLFLKESLSEIIRRRVVIDQGDSVQKCESAASEVLRELSVIGMLDVKALKTIGQKPNDKTGEWTDGFIAGVKHFSEMLARESK